VASTIPAFEQVRFVGVKVAATLVLRLYIQSVELSRYRYTVLALIPWRVLVANGVPDVLAARAQLKRERANQTGRWWSYLTSDPLDDVTYIRPQRGRCASGNDWGTCMSPSMLIRRMPFAKRSLQVKSIEHGRLMKRP